MMSVQIVAVFVITLLYKHCPCAVTASCLQLEDYQAACQ